MYNNFLFCQLCILSNFILSTLYFVKFYFVNSEFCQLLFCQLCFGQLLFCQLCFGQLLFCQLCFGQLLFCQIYFDQLCVLSTLFCQLLFCQTMMIRWWSINIIKSHRQHQHCCHNFLHRCWQWSSSARALPTMHDNKYQWWLLSYSQYQTHPNWWHSWSQNIFTIITTSFQLIPTSLLS